MLFKLPLKKEAVQSAIQPMKMTQAAPAQTVAHGMDASAEAHKAELRRQMYERMARASALAEAEDDAHRLRKA